MTPSSSLAKVAASSDVRVPSRGWRARSPRDESADTTSIETIETLIGDERRLFCQYGGRRSVPDAEEVAPRLGIISTNARHPCSAPGRFTDNAPPHQMIGA